jgi:murein tripeptide amidase MpaA
MTNWKRRSLGRGVMGSLGKAFFLVSLSPCLLVCLSCLLVSLSMPAKAQVPVGKENISLQAFKMPLDWKHFYSYDEMISTLKKIEKAFPNLCKTGTIGKSYQGRDLWMIEIGNSRTGPLDKKPAMYVDGNIHGNEIQGTEISLFLAWYLCNRYGHDKYVTNLIDNRTFYIVPSVNVDARVDFFKNPHTPHSPRWNFRPVDNDQDGLYDEDGPKDIDGDGHISMMRKRDPFGRYKTGSDPRLMVPVEFGEKGEWTILGTEGLDQDGDGQVGEDGPGGVDLNRNFPAGWKPPYQQFGAGSFPFSEPEIRAVGMFIYNHKNIAAVQSFHNNGNLILHPPGAVDDKTLPARDYTVYKAIAKRGEKLLPGYKNINGALELYPTNGDTLDWAYYGCGAMAFTNEIWDLPREFLSTDKVGSNDPGEGDQLKFLDALTHGEGFVNWHPFHHPLYGDIELGGYDQFATRIPPVDYLEDICQRNTQFVLYHAEAMPQLKIHEVKTEKINDSLYRVVATVVNTGYMDTMPEATRQTGAYRPVYATLVIPKGATIVQGQAREEFSPQVDQSRVVKPGTLKRNEARVNLGTINGLSKQVVEWLVTVPNGADAKVTIQVHGMKAGDDVREVELK